MKQTQVKTLLLGVVLASGIFISGCKGKEKDATTNTSADTVSSYSPPAPAPAPVEISSDDALQKGVQDATKDHPGVTATVTNGEINLTGTIERSKLQPLMSSLQSLKPKKVNNNLTIK